MPGTVLYQIAAVVLVVGAVLTAAGNLLAPHGDARAAVASGRFYPIALTVLLGGLLLIVSLPAVYLRQRAESGVLGFAGMVAMLAAGMLLTVGFPLIQLLVYPWIATMNIPSRALSDGPVSFTVVFAAASFVLGFLSIPGGGGIRMSWWWGTTGTFGVVACMVALAWYRIELFRSIDAAPTTEA